MRPPESLVSMLPLGGTVGLYHARAHEAPTGGYARWLHDAGYGIALPAFDDRTSPMHFRKWTDPHGESDLEPGPYGLQPASSAMRVVPSAVIVPLLAFTDDGHRLGQGGGHYDRWLADNPDALPIGLAWDMQRLDALPVEAHDRPLAAVVTPTRIYRSES